MQSLTESEQVTSREFYNNLTLGLVRFLEHVAGIHDVKLKENLPCDQLSITTWEQRYSIPLPPDLKSFYLASDGFKLQWNYHYAGDVLPVGNMIINPISELRRIGGLRHIFDSDSPSLLDIELDKQKCKTPNADEVSTPQFGLRWKIFELDRCEGWGTVCLVYPPRTAIEVDQRVAESQIWFLDRAYEWYYLAPDFTTYFRMLLLHLGLPQWQYRFTDMGLTPWVEQLFSIVAPHLLQSGPEMQNDRFLGKMGPSESICNQLDPAVFKTKSRSERSSRRDRNGKREDSQRYKNS